MKFLLSTLTIIFLISCSNSTMQNAAFTEEHQNGTPLDYYLNFSIKDSVYFEHQDSFQIESIQDLTFEMTFTDAYQSTHKYPYFYNDMTSPDSVDIIGIVRFEEDGTSNFEKSTYDLEFVLSESLENLEKIDDKTYKYLDNFMLYKQLKSNNFGNKNLFGGGNKSTLFMSFPDIGELPNEAYYFIMSSNGFYFPHENLEFTMIEYDELENTITLKGNYNVEIKMLSCGFFSTHAVSNAEFQLIIK